MAPGAVSMCELEHTWLPIVNTCVELSEPRYSAEEEAESHQPL